MYLEGEKSDPAYDPYAKAFGQTEILLRKSMRGPRYLLGQLCRKRIVEVIQIYVTVSIGVAEETLAVVSVGWSLGLNKP